MLFYKDPLRGITILLVHVDKTVINNSDMEVIYKIQKLFHSTFHMNDQSQLLLRVKNTSSTLKYLLGSTWRYSRSASTSWIHVRAVQEPNRAEKLNRNRGAMQVLKIFWLVGFWLERTTVVWMISFFRNRIKKTKKLVFLKQHCFDVGGLSQNNSVYS